MSLFKNNNVVKNVVILSDLPIYNAWEGVQKQVHVCMSEILLHVCEHAFAMHYGYMCIYISLDVCTVYTCVYVCMFVYLFMYRPMLYVRL